MNICKGKLKKLCASTTKMSKIRFTFKENIDKYCYDSCHLSSRRCAIFIINQFFAWVIHNLLGIVTGEIMMAD